MQETLVELPLFPLNTVLFPGGPLPLRIFEPRYLDMISNCMKQSRGFGVMLIKQGQEAGSAAECHNVGTLAQIIDFDQLEDGMLGISCIGTQRLRILSKQVQNNQLIVAQAEYFPASSDDEIPDQQQPLVDFLRNILEREEVQAYRQALSEQWHSADWVSCRLAEILPLSPSSRQYLLEMSEVQQRLQILAGLLQEQKLL